jgi:acyl-CoA reductase-like NAD-dependent aldehyde dehydrogenase
LNVSKLSLIQSNFFNRSKTIQTVVTKLVEGAKKLKIGNPKDETTFIGPMISEDDAKVRISNTRFRMSFQKTQKK